MDNEHISTRRFWVDQKGNVIREWTDEEYATHDPTVPITVNIPVEVRCFEVSSNSDEPNAVEFELY